MNVFILLLYILAIVLFFVSIWNIGIPKFNLVAAGLSAGFLALLLEYLQAHPIQ